MRILFVDPGRITGWFHIDTMQPAESATQGGEMPMQDFLWMAENSISHRAFERVVCEGFVINEQTAQRVKASEPFWSVEQIGCLRYWCSRFDTAFETPSPSAKNFDRNGDKLRRLGWWPGNRGEAGHRRDAGRHAVKWLTDHHVIDLEKLL